MKTALCILAVLIGPASAIAQEDFDLSGEIRGKTFLTKDQRASTLKDYSDYNDYAVAELGALLKMDLPLELRAEAYPYFWAAQEDGLSHIGLRGELTSEILGKDLYFGYGHHSWHNADDDAPRNKGRAQDWLFAEWNFYEIGADSNPILKFFLRGQYFANNTQPIQYKNRYDYDDDPVALCEFRFGMKFSAERLKLEAWPYIQLSEDQSRYGLRAFASYDILSNIAVFSDYEGFSSGGERIHIAAVGLLVRFN